MIDANMLRPVGWSEELIAAASKGSETVKNAAVVETVGGLAVEMTTSPTRGSQRADVSGPPVAHLQLRVETDR